MIEALLGGATTTLPTIAKPVREDSNLNFIISPMCTYVFPYYTTKPPHCQSLIKDKQKTRMGGKVKNYNSANKPYYFVINIPGSQQSSSTHIQGEQVQFVHEQQIPIWGNSKETLFSTIFIFPPMV